MHMPVHRSVCKASVCFVLPSVMMHTDLRIYMCFARRKSWRYNYVLNQHRNYIAPAFDQRQRIAAITLL